jgi:predicted phage tail protein
LRTQKLDEFRERNIEMARKLEQLEPAMERYKNLVGDNPDEFGVELTALRDVNKRVKDGELKTHDEIEQAIQDRVKAIRDGYEDNAKALRTEAQTFRQRADTLAQELDRTKVAGEVTAAVIAPDSGVRPEALPDVLERAYRLFKVENGSLVPKQGEATIFGSNGADPMTPAEWLVKLRDQAPHYFKGNGGGGAAGGKDEKIGGMSAEQIARLSPEAKLALANKNGGGRR